MDSRAHAITVKAFLYRKWGEDAIEIRRFPLDTSEPIVYKDFVTKVADVFPQLSAEHIKLHWIGRFIHCVCVCVRACVCGIPLIATFPLQMEMVIALSYPAMRSWSLPSQARQVNSSECTSCGTLKNRMLSTQQVMSQLVRTQAIRMRGVCFTLMWCVMDATRTSRECATSACLVRTTISVVRVRGRVSIPTTTWPPSITQCPLLLGSSGLDSRSPNPPTLHSQDSPGSGKVGVAMVANGREDEDIVVVVMALDGRDVQVVGMRTSKQPSAT